MGVTGEENCVEMDNRFRTALRGRVRSRGRSKQGAGATGIVGLGIFVVVMALAGCSSQPTPSPPTPTMSALATPHEVPSENGTKIPPASIRKHSRRSAARRSRSAPDLPDYQIIDEEKHDSPAKTQVLVSALVSGAITEPGLRALLLQLYQSATSTRGFEHHGGEPTHVAVFLYPSRKHYDSNEGQWIASLTKLGENAPVETEVKRELVAQLGVPPEEKFGLSESKRMEIFLQISVAEDRAEAEAQRKYPWPMPKDSKAEAHENLMKQSQASEKLRNKGRAEVARRYGLTEAQLNDVSAEGIGKNWPFSRTPMAE